MTTTDKNSLERQFFNSLNQLIEPLVRAGFGFPCFSPAGAIVLETIGRKSGRKMTVPLAATRIGDLLLVSTVRGRSQWIKNLAANPDSRYWLGGDLYEATAFVFSPTDGDVERDLPENVSSLATALYPQGKLFGVSFAILTPRKG
jgi:deazaflavin-dependent oxidoreductase (nitroreductase family)